MSDVMSLLVIAVLLNVVQREMHFDESVLLSFCEIDVVCICK
jgi:hypothetical protein